jgi:predicted RNA binding protein YcfA (HicA-like mRNA interferase family)
MPRLPTVKPRQVVQAFGAHRLRDRPPDRQPHRSAAYQRHRRVVVPWHNRDLGRGLTLRIIKSAGLTRDQFIQLLR